jgi:hypothetical protein
MTRASREHLDPDRCLDLIHGLRDAATADRWLAHLAGCPACERLFRESLMDLAEARAVPAPAGPPRRGARRLIPSLAAAAISVAAVWWVLSRPPDLPEAPALRIPVSEQTTLLRSLESPPDDRLRRGLAAYRSGDDANAVRLLGEARTSGEADRLRRIYLASALQLQGHSAAAIAELDGMDTGTLPEPWRSAARWTQAAALLSEGQAPEARAILGELAEGKGAIAAEARSLLGRASLQSGEPNSTKEDQ